MHTDPCLCPGRPRQMMEVGDRVWMGERVNLLSMDLPSWFNAVTMWSSLKAFPFQCIFGSKVMITKFPLWDVKVSFRERNL